MSSAVLELYAIETVPDIVYVVYNAAYYVAEVIGTLTSKPLRSSFLHDAGFFSLFSFFNFFGVIFLFIYVKETIGLTDLEKKVLYSEVEEADKNGEEKREDPKTVWNIASSTI